EEVVVVDDQDTEAVVGYAFRCRLLRHGSGRTSPGVARILVERDRHDAAAPAECLGRGGEPEVDRRTLDCSARVRGDALAVAGDAEVRPERDHGWIDGDD